MLEVAAAVIKRENKILIARRPIGDHLEGLWEFPGGKLESDETPQECLVREILEELNVEIKVGEYITDSIFEYPHNKIRLMAYWAEWLYGEIKARVHDEIKWVFVDALSEFSFAPADIPIVCKIKREKCV